MWQSSYVWSKYAYDIDIHWDKRGKRVLWDIKNKYEWNTNKCLSIKIWIIFTYNQLFSISYLYYFNQFHFLILTCLTICQTIASILTNFTSILFKCIINIKCLTIWNQIIAKEQMCSIFSQHWCESSWDSIAQTKDLRLMINQIILHPFQ